MVRQAAKKLYDQHIFAIFPIAAVNKSDSHSPGLQSLKHPNVEQPSVLKHFDRIPNCNPPPDSPPPIHKITDRFPDRWIE